jgi:hypothetical protein
MFLKSGFVILVTFIETGCVIYKNRIYDWSYHYIEKKFKYRFHEVISISYFVINEYKIQILYYKKNLPLLNWCALTETASELYIEFLSAQTILAVSIYKENATFVTDFNTTKVRYLDVIVPPRLIPKEFQLLVYILHFWALAAKQVRNTRQNSYINFIFSTVYVYCLFIFFLVSLIRKYFFD